MKNWLTRQLSALTVLMATTFPAINLVTRWQYGHLRRTAAERPLEWLDFVSAGVMVWFVTGMVVSLTTVALVQPLHRWLGVTKDAPKAEDEADDEPPTSSGGTLRARTV